MADLLAELTDPTKPQGELRPLCIRAAKEIERLMAAADRVCWFDWSGNDPDAEQAVAALRKMLTGE